MAKRLKTKTQASKREINWAIIGGVIGVGVIALFAILFLSFRAPEQQTLADYCLQNPDRCISQGNPDAAVTIVEVSDFECPYCARFHTETLPALQAQYIDTDQVHYLILPYSLSPDPTQAGTTLPGANAAMCANEQVSFAAYGDLLFAQQGTDVAMTRDGFVQAAEQMELDMDAFNQCLDEGRYYSVVQANVAAAQDAGVSATPSFFINDRILEGALPLSVFQQRIDASLNE